MTQDTPTRRDVIDTLLDSTPGSPLAELRAKRANLAQFTQDSYDALLEPSDPAGISRVERLVIALRSAALAPSAQLAAHYRDLLKAEGANDGQIDAVDRFPSGDGLSQREALLLQYTDLLSRDPKAGTPDDLALLTDGGFSTRDIVTVSQLISFVSYQARLLAGLRAIKEAL